MSTPQDQPKVLRETDDAARSQACSILRQARVAALATHEAGTAWPLASRVSLANMEDGCLVILISRLSAHFAALEGDARCSLLVNEAEKDGDPLRVARMTVMCSAMRLDRVVQTQARAHAREAFLRHIPEAEMYADFGDFDFWQLRIVRASLNAGFGRAYALSAQDLRP
ncbi:MAG: HugZ family protein [Brachymonas sp.]